MARRPRSARQRQAETGRASSLRARIGLSARAQKDWARLDAATHLRIVRALEALAADPRPSNVDGRPLVGAAPWQRLRLGDLRMIFRALTRSELIGFPEDRGY